MNGSSQNILQVGLLSLPTELLAHIAGMMRESKDLMCLSLTCKVFHAIMMGNVAVWKSQAKRLGYDKGITMPTMNLLSKAYLVLWVVENKPFRPIPIVGITYNVTDPVLLRNIALPPEILEEFKSRINAITTAPYPYYTKKGKEAWGEFKTMTSLSDQEICEQVRSRWAIGPLGNTCSHLVILEYVIQHCFSAKVLPKGRILRQGSKPLSENTILLGFETGICGMAMSALLAELKCRAYYIGLNLSIEDTFGNLIILFPSVSGRHKRKAIRKLRKLYVAIDATKKPWCLCKPLLPPSLFP